MNKKIERRTGIEILRIIAMLMIVALHYVNLGGVSTKGLGFNLYFARFIQAITYSCVDIFVLITGFFWNKNTRPITKAAKLWLQTLFYSVGCLLVVSLINGFSATLSVKRTAYAFFPFTTHHYWFVAVYALLLFAAPVLNVVVEKFDFVAHTFLIGFIGLSFVLPGTVLPARFTFDAADGYGILWFCCLYFIGAYLQKYEPLRKVPKAVCFIVAGVMSFLLFLSGVVIQLLHNRGIIPDWWGLCYGYLSFPVVVSAVFLFEGLKDFDIKNSKLANVTKWVSSRSLGVYLLHSNVIIGSFLYRNIFKTKSFYDSPYMIFHFMFFVFSVFVSGIAVEEVRILLFGKLNDRIAAVIKKKTDALIEKIKAGLVAVQAKSAAGE